MPRLRDLPIAAKRLGPWCLLKRIWEQMWTDRLPVWASALAYSWLFAVFPFFIFLMTLVAFLPTDPKTVRDQVNHVVGQAFPKEGATTFAETVEQIIKEKPSGFMSLGLLIAVWSASGGMATTMSALNRCYEVEEDLPFYKARPIAIGLTLVVAVLIVLALVLLPLGTFVTEWLTKRGGIAWLAEKGIRLTPAVVLTWEILRWTLGLCLLLGVVAILYHIAPRVRHRFRFLTPGGIFTVACWIVLGYAFRYYVDHFASYSKMYGAVGGVVVLLLIFYLDGLVLLIGAELNAEIDYIMTATPVNPDGQKAEATPTEGSDLEPASVEEANENHTVQPAL